MTADIQKILTSSRTNNGREGVTGALLYNQGNFAQVLEGPLARVGQIFERIQCDPRHSEVTVVESAPVDGRNFPEWSMAFAGNDKSDLQPLAKAAFSAAFAGSAGAGTQILALLQELITQEDDWILVNA